MLDFWYREHDIAPYFGEIEDIVHQFLDLVADLARRSGTVATDEPICITRIVGLGLEQFHPYPTMVDIYRSFLNFPQDVLLVPGPKLQEPGFRWALTSFLHQEHTVFWRAQKPGTRTDEGFQICNDCIIFHEELDLQFDQEAHPGIHFVTTPGNGDFAFQRCSETKLVQSFKASAIILQLEGFENISRSVVVSHLVERDGIVYCNYESNVNTWKVNEFTMDDINYCAGESDDQERSHTTSGDFDSQVTFHVD